MLCHWEKQVLTPTLLEIELSSWFVKRESQSELCVNWRRDGVLLTASKVACFIMVWKHRGQNKGARVVAGAVYNKKTVARVQRAMQSPAVHCGERKRTELGVHAGKPLYVDRPQAHPLGPMPSVE